MERWGRAAVPCAPTVACPATRPSWRPRATGTRIVSWRWPTNWHPPHAPILRAQTPGPGGPLCLTVAVGSFALAEATLTAMRRTTTKTVSARAPPRPARHLRRPTRRRPHPRRRRPRPRRRCCLTTISSAEPNFRCSGAMERWGRAAVPCAPTVACPATRPSWRPRATGTRIVSWRWPTNWHPPHAPILRAQTPGPGGPLCLTVAVGSFALAEATLTAMRRTTTKTVSARAPDRCACCPHPWHGLVRGNFISLYHLSFLCTRFVCGDLFSLDIVTCASRLHRFCHIGFLELAGARHGAG